MQDIPNHFEIAQLIAETFRGSVPTAPPEDLLIVTPTAPQVSARAMTNVRDELVTVIDKHIAAGKMYLDLANQEVLPPDLKYSPDQVRRQREKLVQYYNSLLQSLADNVKNRVEARLAGLKSQPKKAANNR